jgi:RNA polymerase-interacting CarD/CdnL/TRCF family regulator
LVAGRSFLLTDRVELNALASDDLVAWIEAKLGQHGIRKIVPDNELLAETYRVFKRSKRVEKIMAEELKKQDDGIIAVPGDLRKQVVAHLAENPGSNGMRPCE